MLQMTLHLIRSSPLGTFQLLGFEVGISSLVTKERLFNCLYGDTQRRDFQLTYFVRQPN
jgi:hypothetical protein